MARFEAARPKITADTDAVWVFSGFGTYFRPWLDNHPIWGAWNDQRNITRGILIVLEVTALRTGKGIKEISKDEIVRLGPKLIYNGEPSQNDALRYAMKEGSFPLQPKSVIMVDEVLVNGKHQAIRGTHHQFQSFPRKLLGKEIKGAVALVSGAPHFSRLLRYNAFYRTIPGNFDVRSFPVPTFDAFGKFADQEVGKLVKYLAAGDLVEDPLPADLGL